METWQSWLSFGISLVVAAAIAAAALIIVGVTLRKIAVREPKVGIVRKWSRIPFRSIIGLLVVWGVVAATFPLRGWIPGLRQLFSVLIIAFIGWLLVSLVYVLADVSAARYAGAEDTVAARRVRTQMTMVRRLLIVVILVVAVGSILMTFPGIRTIGASVLASAGVASIVAGLAAQTVLGNLIAGMQLAFSGQARVGDVVVVEEEWGTIGEITLAYVVVDIWDERRLILPCTYFTSQPYVNWTRNYNQILGTIAFDIDWRVNIAAMRKKLHEVLESTDLWDGRSGSFQMIDATGGYIRVRSTVSAADSGKLWDLQCLVREEVVTWLQKQGSFSLPVTRVQMVEGDNLDRRLQRSKVKDAEAEAEQQASGMFSGSPEAEARGNMFTGAISIQEAEQLESNEEERDLAERRAAGLPPFDEATQQAQQLYEGQPYPQQLYAPQQPYDPQGYPQQNVAPQQGVPEQGMGEPVPQAGEPVPEQQPVSEQPVTEQETPTAPAPQQNDEEDDRS